MKTIKENAFNETGFFDSLRGRDIEKRKTNLREFVIGEYEFDGKKISLKEYLDRFDENNRLKKYERNEYSYLIIPVGLEPIPVILTMHAIKAKKKVYMISSKESLEYKEVYRKYYEEHLKQEIKLEFEEYFKFENQDENTDDGLNTETETTRAFEKVDEIYRDINELGEKSKIAISVTTGKKTSMMACFLGSFINESNETDIYYIDGYRKENQYPDAGTEFMIRIINPNNIFKESQRKYIKNLFDNANYKQSEYMAAELLKNMKKEKNLLENYNLKHVEEELEIVKAYSIIYGKRMNYDMKELKDETLNMIENEKEREYFELLRRFDDEIKEKYDEIERTKDEKKVESKIKFIGKKYKEDERYSIIALDRYESAIKYREIDNPSYIMRLTSTIEYVSTIASKAKETNLFGKINKSTKMVGNDNGIIPKLHKIRMERNNLGFTHGFNSASDEKTYEENVKEFIKKAFKNNSYYNKNKKEISEALKFKTYDEIVQGGK